MRFLQIRIGLVERVAQTIVRERHDLVRRNYVANAGRAPGSHTRPSCVLVEVVAEVQHEVEVVARGDAAHKR